MATPAPMKTAATVMAIPSCHALSRTRACSGNSTTAVPTVLSSRTGRRPMRSDSAPHSGITATSTRLATTPASRAALESMPSALMA